MVVVIGEHFVNEEILCSEVIMILVGVLYDFRVVGDYSGVMVGYSGVVFIYLLKRVCNLNVVELDRGTINRPCSPGQFEDGHLVKKLSN